MRDVVVSLRRASLVAVALCAACTDSDSGTVDPTSTPPDGGTDEITVSADAAATEDVDTAGGVETAARTDGVYSFRVGKSLPPTSAPTWVHGRLEVEGALVTGVLALSSGPPAAVSGQVFEGDAVFKQVVLNKFDSTVVKGQGETHTLATVTISLSHDAVVFDSEGSYNEYSGDIGSSGEGPWVLNGGPDEVAPAAKIWGTLKHPLDTIDLVFGEPIAADGTPVVVAGHSVDVSPGTTVVGFTNRMAIAPTGFFTPGSPIAIDVDVVDMAGNTTQETLTVPALPGAASTLSATDFADGQHAFAAKTKGLEWGDWGGTATLKLEYGEAWALMDVPADATTLSFTGIAALSSASASPGDKLGWHVRVVANKASTSTVYAGSEMTLIPGEPEGFEGVCSYVVAATAPHTVSVDLTPHVGEQALVLLEARHFEPVPSSYTTCLLIDSISIE